MIQKRLGSPRAANVPFLPGKLRAGFQDAMLRIAPQRLSLLSSG